MTGVLDSADRAFWWLRDHPPVAAGLAAVIVALIAVLLFVKPSDGVQTAAGTIPPTAVAMVGDLPITKSELAHWRDIYVRTSSTGISNPTPQQVTTAVFELLAGSAWITQEAKRVGIVVTTEEVAKEADEFLTAAATATKATRTQVLTQISKTEEDVRFQQRSALLANALQQRVIDALPEPSDADVRKTYAAEPQRWARPTKRDAEVLITADKASATAALSALRTGASFKIVTQRYSANTALTESGGALKDVRPGSNDPTLERPLFRASRGTLQGPVAVDGGWLVFRVQKITALARRTLAQATPAIRKDLAATAQAKAVDGYLDALRRRWQPQTRCSSAVMSKMYCGRAS